MKYNIYRKGFWDWADYLYLEPHQFVDRVASENKVGFKLSAAKEQYIQSYKIFFYNYEKLGKKRIKKYYGIY
jgi:hypothetical protein